ncbi:hypothetical protein Gohar_028324 [Gossypium harknessii]|uniref:Uncharacterized protein n=1 Tax=Gossypium harknessii TaxID=34285 RepID=A0A7J9IF97_9ROSI|nr:hypothetical protein [Gossypium harknessii]
MLERLILVYTDRAVQIVSGDAATGKVIRNGNGEWIMGCTDIWANAQPLMLNCGKFFTYSSPAAECSFVDIQHFPRNQARVAGEGRCNRMGRWVHWGCCKKAESQAFVLLVFAIRSPPPP